MDIRVNMIPVIDFEEIECAMDLKMEDFAFYRRADHSEGYFWINTDEDAIPDLEAEIEEEKELANKYGYCVDEEFINHLKNDITLVSQLRAMGLTDSVLIYVWY
jgi:hypothetical protein